jgi:uncharacterized protein YidB (DUF937 family)
MKMSLLDQVTSLAGSALGGDASNAGLLGNLMQLVTGSEGGLSSLIGAFQHQGLGDVVQSWLGSGSNLPISAEQIQQVFGTEKLQQLTEGTGLNTSEVAGQLSNLLPDLVSKFSSSGLGENLDLGNLANSVKGLFS